MPGVAYSSGVCIHTQQNQAQGTEQCRACPVIATSEAVGIFKLSPGSATGSLYQVAYLVTGRKCHIGIVLQAKLAGSLHDSDQFKNLWLINHKLRVHSISSSHSFTMSKFTHAGAVLMRGFAKFADLMMHVI